MTDTIADGLKVLPEAPHWNGVGKYGPALCMDNITLHIMSRGFGAKDGDGYLTHDPTECDWERDDDGKDCAVVPVSNSDLLFLRDKLNELFPPNASVPAELVERVARAIYRDKRNRHYGMVFESDEWENAHEWQRNEALNAARAALAALSGEGR